MIGDDDVCIGRRIGRSRQILRIGEDLDPVADVHGSAEYRREMARVVARRAVCQAIGIGGLRRG